MYWTLELASYLEDAPWPASKDELIDFAMLTGAPLEVVENLQQLQEIRQQYNLMKIQEADQMVEKLGLDAESADEDE